MENSLIIQKTEQNLSTGITLSLFTDHKPNKEIVKMVEQDLQTLKKLALQLPNLSIIGYGRFDSSHSIYDNMDITTFNFLAKKYDCKVTLSKTYDDLIYYSCSLKGNSCAIIRIDSEKISIEIH